MRWKVKVHICERKEKSCSAGETALGSFGVNIIINGRVSLGTPHLLEHFSGFFGSAPPFCPRYHFHMSLEEKTPRPFSRTADNRHNQTHAALIADHPLQGNNQRHPQNQPKYPPPRQPRIS